MEINDKVKVKILNKYWCQGKVLQVVHGDVDYVCVEIPLRYSTIEKAMYIEVPIAEVIKVKKERGV